MIEKNEKGITLVALVVTIVVLLILAGISISLILGQNGIIGKAKQTTSSTEQKKAEEEVTMMLGEFVIEKTTGNDDLEGYLNKQKSDGKLDEVTKNDNGTHTVELYGYEISFRDDDLTIISSEKTGGIRPTIETAQYQTDGNTLEEDKKYVSLVLTVKIANKSDLNTIDSIELFDSTKTKVDKLDDVIGDNTADASFKISKKGNYTVTAKGTKDGIQKSKTIPVEVIKISTRLSLKVGDYIEYNPETENTSYTLSTADSGYDSEQTIKRDDTLTWRILNVNPDETVNIICVTPAAGKVYIKGPTGYNNGAYILNNICKNLYSHGTSINARSINLKDIEDKMTPDGKKTRDNLVFRDYQNKIYAKYGQPNSYVAMYSHYPNLYENEIGAGINTKTIKTDGLTQQDSASLDHSENASKIATEGLTAKQTYYSMSYSALVDNISNLILKTSDYYWIASRYVKCGDTAASFGIFKANSCIYQNDLYTSVGDLSSEYSSLRPLVTIGADVDITPCTGDNSSTNTHKVK